MRLALLCLLAACGGARGTAPLGVAPVAALADIHADQVVTQGDVTYALGAQLAIARGTNITVLVPVDCGTPTCPAQVWTSAAAIPALDGDGRWVVAVRFDGTLWRIRLDGELEAIGSRFGIARERVLAVSGAGSIVGVLLEHALLVTTDGVHLTRFELDGSHHSLAVAHDRIALASDHAIALWDLGANTRRSFAIEAGRPAFLAADSTAPRLVVSAPHGIWLEHGSTLEPLEVGAGAASAVAGARLWLELGKRLYVVTDTTPLDTSAASAGNEPLFGTPNGDVWVGDHGLRRYALGASTGDPIWTAKIQPIFQRVCAHCHLPGGDADIDLSTAAAWDLEHDELVRRVLVTKTMPPAGTVLSDGDRLTLAAWLKP